MRPSETEGEAREEGEVSCDGGGGGGGGGGGVGGGGGQGESGKDVPYSLPPALRAPAHLIARVFSQLDCTDLLSCSLVCKQWYRDSAELREDWKNEYLEAWNLYGLCIQRETHPPSSSCSIRGVHSWCP